MMRVLTSFEVGGMPKARWGFKLDRELQCQYRVHALLRPPRESINGSRLIYLSQTSNGFVSGPHSVFRDTTAFAYAGK